MTVPISITSTNPTIQSTMESNLTEEFLLDSTSRYPLPTAQSAILTRPDTPIEQQTMPSSIPQTTTELPPDSTTMESTSTLRDPLLAAESEILTRLETQTSERTETIVFSIEDQTIYSPTPKSNEPAPGIANTSLAPDSTEISVPSESHVNMSQASSGSDLSTCLSFLTIATTLVCLKRLSYSFVT